MQNVFAEIFNPPWSATLPRADSFDLTNRSNRSDPSCVLNTNLVALAQARGKTPLLEPFSRVCFPFSMKVKFETIFRGVMVFLALTLVGAVWAAPETTTNAEVADHPNGPSAMVGGVEHLEEPYLTFGLDRIEPLQKAIVLGEPVWKYLASLIYLLLAVFVAKLLDLIAAGWLKRLATRTETRLDDVLVELISGPIKVVAFAVLANVGLNVFEWPEKARVYLSNALVLVVAASLTWVTVKMTGVLLDTWRERFAHESDGRFDDQLFSVIRKCLSAFTIVMAVLVTAQNIGINITAALTSLSIGGLAVGLAAQDTLANLFGAVAVFADKPFRVGDQIKLDALEGTVGAVGPPNTRVRNLHREFGAIPHKTVGNPALV